MRWWLGVVVVATACTFPDVKIDDGVVDCSDPDKDDDQHDDEACGGDDCDDTDARAHPGQTSYFEEANAVIGFDYDCSGTPTQEFATDACTGVTCTTASVFISDTPVACGSDAVFATCTMLCMRESITSKKVACH
jgi:hypothetical protein